MSMHEPVGNQWARTWRPHYPRPAGPRRAEAARRVARAGHAAIRRQHPSSRGRSTEGLCPGAGCGELIYGHLRGIGPRTRNLEGSWSPATEQPGIRSSE